LEPPWMATGAEPMTSATVRLERERERKREREREIGR